MTLYSSTAVPGPTRRLVCSVHVSDEHQNKYKYRYRRGTAVRNKNHLFPEKVTNPQKGTSVENPENGLNPF